MAAYRQQNNSIMHSDVQVLYLQYRLGLGDGGESQYLSGWESAHPFKSEQNPVPTAFEELQVCVSVVQELHVVIGRRVGVLLFLGECEKITLSGNTHFCFAGYTSTYRHTCTEMGEHC